MRPVLSFCLLLSTLLAILPLTLSAEPVTVTHKYGTVTLETPPARVVSVGYHEQDFLYALGIAPVGVHEWFGGRPHATWIWAEEARAALGAQPEVQRGFEIDLEWVWQQKPDLIVATFAPLDKGTYETLSRIAPVLGPPAGHADWTAPWQEELRLIAAATDRSAKAEEVIAQVEGTLDALAADHPELAGREAAVVYLSETELIGYGSGDGANRMLADLGLRVPAEFDEMVTGAGNFSVSLERLDIFDRDVALWLTEGRGREMIETLPAYRDSGLARENRSVWADEDEMGAMSFQSPLSIPWAAKRLLPRLAKAVTGRSRD
ncbi:ABC transporter substrate-binding protein [Celeribacter indicus]|uniref:Periplasmic binding protein n=1 Tax=Celeribacter indicus TaxID=1208324 RepID=A0A0B5DZ65_9RHOB|nr:ABC transporter substrate-binding protein [Celeribacter indicus]AJE48703.1 periplasmic binding protein [Celeribacter indicus]SDX12539.1 iron complex transport system substrate-binding protein [Celeribacter indicus]